MKAKWDAALFLVTEAKGTPFYPKRCMWRMALGGKKTINNPFQWCTVIVFSWYLIWRCPPWWYHSNAYTSQEDAIILMTRMCEPFYHVSQCIKCIFKKCTVSRLGDLRQSPAGCLAGDWFLSETLVVISAAPLLALFFGHYTYITLIWSVKCKINK